MNCEFWSKTHPVCKLGMYGGMPSRGMCQKCISNGQNNEEHARTVKKRVNGLGDIVYRAAQPIAKAIDATIGTNIQNCGGCKKRRDKLNEMFPIKIE